MKRLLTGCLLVILLLLTTAACAKPAAPPPFPTPTPTPTPVPAPAPMSPGGIKVPVPTIIVGGSRGESYDTGTSPSTVQDRMIVRTGDISLVVEDVIDSLDEIAQLAASYGGFVVSSRIYGEENDRRGSISIRVPSDKFDQALAELRQNSVRVSSESTQGQDVTEEYIDLKSRLTNAEATEKQYLALLDKAVTVEDIIRIYDSLSRVRSEIEQLKGRMQYLERTSSMSLITVNLRAETSARPLVRAGWNALEVLKAAFRGLTTFGQWLGNVALWLIVFSPVWGVVLGVLYWFRHRKKKAQ